MPTSNTTDYPRRSRDKNDPAWYALRRTLPPWRFEENLAELVEQLPKYKVDEIIVKVDTEEFSHGHPSLAWGRDCQRNLFRLKQKMSEIGVVYSLNPWITVGHCDRGRDDRERLPGLLTMVGHDGIECRHCACPLSEVWRDHEAKLWSLYAETEPAVIWVEDDIRTFNHQPIAYGCFCAEHMRRFSKLAGCSVEREELVAAILAPGRPHPWRRLYLQMQSEVITETVGWLTRVVHEVSPDTNMGLMSSGPRRHCLEGRDWEKSAKALADGGTLYSRPPMGNYHEESLRGFYYSHDSIKLTRHALPAGVIEQTEVENLPFTRYSKSVNATFIEIALSFAYGAHGVTLNLYDHMGTPMEEESAFGRMLGKRKGWLNALAEIAQTSANFRGVQLLFSPASSYDKHLIENAEYSDLVCDGYEMMLALEHGGIATTYEPSEVVAVSGQLLRGFSDQRIEELLQGGIFLDAVAAGILFERGFGPDIGLAQWSEPVRHYKFKQIISAEEYYNPDFGGGARQYLTATLPSLGAEGVRFCQFTPLPQAMTISRWVDCDAKPVGAAMYAFNNQRGGQVVVHGMDYRTAVGSSFHNPLRKKQLQHITRFLSRGRPELLFNCDGAFPLAWRQNLVKDTVLGAFNLSLDSWGESSFELAWDSPLSTIKRLDSSGRWREDPALSWESGNGVLRIRINREINFKLPLVLQLVTSP